MANVSIVAEGSLLATFEVQANQFGEFALGQLNANGVQITAQGFTSGVLQRENKALNLTQIMPCQRNVLTIHLLS